MTGLGSNPANKRCPGLTGKCSKIMPYWDSHLFVGLVGAMLVHVTPHVKCAQIGQKIFGGNLINVCTEWPRQDLL